MGRNEEYGREMIITSTLKLEIGKIYSNENIDEPFEYLNKIVPHYSFKVIEEKSIQDFIEFVTTEFPHILPSTFRKERYFYEIQTD